MNELATKTIPCPYCGERIDILIDCSISQQNYIEDCQVCCRPIILNITVEDEGKLIVTARHENE
jgi:hypothetical protein